MVSQLWIFIDDIRTYWLMHLLCIRNPCHWNMKSSIIFGKTNFTYVGNRRLHEGQWSLRGWVGSLRHIRCSLLDYVFLGMNYSPCASKCIVKASLEILLIGPSSFSETRSDLIHLGNVTTNNHWTKNQTWWSSYEKLYALVKDKVSCKQKFEKKNLDVRWRKAK